MSDMALAFAQLRAGLVRFGRRRLDNQASAEDVAQEALRRVLEAQRAGRIRDPAALGAFATETARRVIQQLYRDRMRDRRAFERLHHDEADGAASPIDELIAEQQCRDVRAALAKLEHPERTLLAAVYEEEADPTEAAGRLGVRPGTLRVRKHRALQKLGALLPV